jgi:hypothetical protein
MAIPSIYSRKEDLELITNKDLVAAAHGLLGGIELDVASSKVANTFVQAEKFYTPSDDGLNAQEWYGKVYLFPPSGAYFWDKKSDKWKMTRSSSPSLVSSHAIWFRKLFKFWYSRQVSEALYFSNCPDIIRYEQQIFDFPVCILRTAPSLIKNTSQGISRHKTCTSLLVYLPPLKNTEDAIQNFVDIYSEKGRVLC